MKVYYFLYYLMLMLLRNNKTFDKIIRLGWYPFKFFDSYM